LKDVIEGRMEGKRTRGRRRRIGMIDELIEGTYGMNSGGSGGAIGGG